MIQETVADYLERIITDIEQLKNSQPLTADSWLVYKKHTTFAATSGRKYRITYNVTGYGITVAQAWRVFDYGLSTQAGSMYFYYPSPIAQNIWYFLAPTTRTEDVVILSNKDGSVTIDDIT